jgi:hypothetical protein
MSAVPDALGSCAPHRGSFRRTGAIRRPDRPVWRARPIVPASEWTFTMYSANSWGLSAIQTPSPFSRRMPSAAIELITQGRPLQRLEATLPVAPAPMRSGAEPQGVQPRLYGGQSPQILDMAFNPHQNALRQVQPDDLKDERRISLPYSGPDVPQEILDRIHIRYVVETADETEAGTLLEGDGDAPDVARERKDAC